MRKIDKAVEIVRGWSDEELEYFLADRLCPAYFKMKNCEVCNEHDAGSCGTGWNEEVENE